MYRQMTNRPPSRQVKNNIVQLYNVILRHSASDGGKRFDMVSQDSFKIEKKTPSAQKRIVREIGPFDGKL